MNRMFQYHRNLRKCIQNIGVLYSNGGWNVSRNGKNSEKNKGLPTKGKDSSS